MKLKLVLAVLVLLFTVQARATTYTVKPGGNFTTVNACAQQAVAGDTCQIYAGTYNETVTPKNSGAAGNPITYATNPGDVVTITGFNLGSQNYIVIQGSQNVNLKITSGITWLVTTHSVFQYISETGGSCIGGNGWYTSKQPSSYNQFLNLTLASCGGVPAGPAIELEGHFNLFDGITCSYAQACITLSGQFNVIRNSTFGPTSEAVLGGQHSQPVEASVSCGGSNSDIASGLQHLLMEENYSAQWRGGNSHATILNTDTPSNACGTTTNILRFNQSMDSGSYSVQIYSSLNNYSYNNSFSNTQLDSSPKDKEDFTFNQGGDVTTGTRAINNILANMTQVGSEDWCIYADSPITENHNLCFNSGWTGGWYGPTTAQSANLNSTDILNADPKFTAPDTNLTLQAGSPAIAAGGPLTTATNSGTSSTAMTVADAGFFFANVGMPGNYQPDWIRIGPSTTVQISAINYSTNTLTLATAVSWTSGTPIYLYKNSNGTVVLNGANPNIGFDQGTATHQPAPPTNLKAVPN